MATHAPDGVLVTACIVNAKQVVATKPMTTHSRVRDAWEGSASGEWGSCSFAFNRMLAVTTPPRSARRRSSTQVMAKNTAAAPTAGNGPLNAHVSAKAHTVPAI